MDRQEIATRSRDLMRRSKVALVGSVAARGFPYVKAMFNLDPESLAVARFSTNTSSGRVGQFRDNPKACVYYCDEQTFEGLLLVGTMTIRQDAESRTRLWREGFEKYYPQGVGDPDYSVLEFTADTANYYHGLSNLWFDPADVTRS